MDGRGGGVRQSGGAMSGSDGIALKFKWGSYNLINFPFMHFANARGWGGRLTAAAIVELWVFFYGVG